MNKASTPSERVAVSLSFRAVSKDRDRSDFQDRYPPRPAVLLTFAGAAANASLAHALATALDARVTHDSFKLGFPSHVQVPHLQETLAELRDAEPSEMQPAIDERAGQGLNFSQCLPHERDIDMLQRRFRDDGSLAETIRRPHRFVAAS